LSQDRSTVLDYYAIGVATYPMTMADYYLYQSATAGGAFGGQDAHEK